MPKPIKTLALVAVLALTLPGCSALFGTNRLASRSTGDEPAPLAQAERPSVFTQMGRRALDQGNTGLAIEAFQRAAAGNEAPAPAFNGLGVAFARLGRFDLAQRYFEQAATLDPAEPRYQTNLARLMRSPLFAQRHDADRAAEMVAAAQREEDAKAKQQAAAEPGQLQRVAANQFFIRTAAPDEKSGPVRTAMIITRAKPKADLAPAKASKPVPEPVSAADLPAEDKPKSRTILFKAAAPQP